MMLLFVLFNILFLLFNSSPAAATAAAASAYYKCNFTKMEEFIRFERDPIDCRVFYICAFNRTYTLSCVKGFYFDIVKNKCNYAHLVECSSDDSMNISMTTTTTMTTVQNSTENDNNVLRIGEISDIIYNAANEEEEQEQEEFELDYGEEEDGEQPDEFEVEVEIEDNEENEENEDDDDDDRVMQMITIPFNLFNVNTTLEKLILSTLNTTTTTKTTTTAFTTTSINDPTIMINETTTAPLNTTSTAANNSTRPWWLGPTECIVGFQHRIPHDSNCGKYYECQTNGEKIEYACIYPMQFDEFYYECRPYDTVDCGTRKEAKDLCDYRLSKSTLHSIPCYMYPSCKNLTDGYYPDILRDCRHYFQCKDERTINTNFCPQNSTFGGLKFNHFTKKCDLPMRVSYTCGGFSIPIDIYTNEMLCPMSSMITYYSHPSECHIYLSCLNGRIQSMECPEGTHFSGKHQKCMEPELAKCESAKSSTHDPSVTTEITTITTEMINEITTTTTTSPLAIINFNNTNSFEDLEDK